MNSAAAMHDDDRTVIRPAAAATGNALPAGTGLGEFVVVRVIGEGGFGIVYEAIDRTLQRHVAVKEFMPSSLALRNGDGRVAVKSERQRETFEMALRSFVNEARLLASFDHPALLKVHRFWEANGTAYMAMPLYDGITLRDTLQRAAEPPSQALLLALLGPLTEALLVLHGQQCFHRDIAPDNILLLAGSGAPLLLDFGAARRVIGDMTQQALTVILKPGYAPIEQYAQTPGLQQGPWTDVYALAAVVYFAIARRTPPPAVGRLVDDDYEPLSTLAAGRYSTGFLAAIDRALAVQPAQRTRSIDEFRAQLGFAPKAQASDSGWSQFGDSTRGGSGSTVSDWAASEAPLRPTAPPRPAPSRGRWLGVAAGVAAVGLGIGATLYVIARNETVVTTPTTTPPVAVVASDPPAADAPALPPAAPADAFEQALLAQTPGFEVRTSGAKNSLRINHDQLAFSVTSARDGFVQLLLREPDGTMLLVFPNARSSRNRIRAGQALPLPQPTWPMYALEPPGLQQLLVVVTAQPRDFTTVTTQPRPPFAALDAARVPALVAQGDYGAAAFDVQIVR